MKNLFISIVILMNLNASAQQSIAFLELELSHSSDEAYYDLVVELFDVADSIYLDSLYGYEYPKAFSDYLEKANKWVSKSGVHKQTVLLDKLYLNYYVNKLEFTAAIKMGRHLLLESEFLTAQQYNDILDNLSYAYYRQRYFIEYIQLIPIKSEFREKEGIVNKLGYEYFEIGLVYYNTNQYAKARQYFKEGIVLSKSYLDEFLEASMYNNIALTFEKNKLYDSAVVYYNIAIVKAEHSIITKDTYRRHFIDIIKSNKAKLTVLEGDFYTAIPYLKKEIRGGYEHSAFNSIAEAYNDLANIYILRNNAKLALRYLDSASIVQAKIDVAYTYEETLGLRARALLLLGKLKEANTLLILQSYLSDSLKAEVNKKSIESSKVIFETNKKEIEIRNQKLELSEKNSIIIKQNEARNTLQIGFALSLLIIVVVVLFYLYLTKAKQQIELQKEALNNALDQKNLLFKEMHHRVKNNLQIISGLLHLQSSKTNNDEVKDMMQQGQSRIDAMALIHQMLYQNTNFKSVEIKKYLTDLTNQLASSYPSSKYITIEINVCNINIDIDKAVPIGLITNELVTNAYKHAFNDKKGVIEIALHLLENGKYQYQISDNGCGLADNYESKSSNSLGMKLVEMLRKEIRASLKVTNEKGAKFIFELEL